MSNTHFNLILFMNNFGANYGKILEILKQVENKKIFFNQIRIPKLSDIELIALDITAEYMSIDFEYQLFRKIPKQLSVLIERSVYNRRRRRLFFHRQRFQKLIAANISSSDYYIVDSMPLEVCKLSRSSRCKICSEDFETSPDKGYCATQRTNYYGYKLHAVCTIDGVFTDFDLSKASVHDIHYLKNIKHNHSQCVILGDKAYLSKEYQIRFVSFEPNRVESSDAFKPIRLQKTGFYFS